MWDIGEIPTLGQVGSSGSDQLAESVEIQKRRV